MKKRADRTVREVCSREEKIERMVTKAYGSARVSLILIVSMIIVMFGSVCAVNVAAGSGRTAIVSEESVDLAQVTSSEFIIETTEETTIVTSETIEIEQLEALTVDSAKRGCLAKAPGAGELASMSDDELVNEITSGNAGVIARSDITTNAANEVDTRHTGQVASAPAATATPTPVPASAETEAAITETTISTLGYELGIDVSTFQGDIDWAKVKAAGYSFAIIRCGGRYWGSSGGLYTDSRFVKNIRGAKAAGLKVGVYFFSQAITAYEALEEASLTLSQLGGMSLDYPVVMDWETGSSYRTWNLYGQDFANVITAFCSTIAQNGYTPMVYLNTSDITSRLGSSGSSVLSKYKLWYALPYSSYQNGSKYQPGDATPSKSFSYSIWQYSWWGQVPGISYPVDLNLSYLGTTSLAQASINLTTASYTTAVGETISPLAGVSASTSLSKTVTDGITYTIKDSSGNTVSLEQAAASDGIYTITYRYKDTYRGTVTATATWTVGNPSATTETTAATSAESTTETTASTDVSTSETTTTETTVATTVTETTAFETTAATETTAVSETSASQ